jgi:peroxiredoxin Q/BCP
MSSDATTRLEAGSPMPAFSGPDQSGTVRSSKDYAGSPLVVYFYPRAFTPGCTTESCDFRDRYQTFSDAGYQIIGVSPDTPGKLAEFRAEYELPFDLISDPDHDIAKAFGAYGTKKNYGKEYEGIIRSTFVVDGDGTVEQAFYNVRAKGHAERVAGALGT